MYIIHSIPAMLALATCFMNSGASLPQDLSSGSFTAARLHRRTPAFRAFARTVRTGSAQFAAKQTKTPKPDNAAKNAIDTLNNVHGLTSKIPDAESAAVSVKPPAKPNLPNIKGASKVQAALHKP
ncbi:hypothetical protein H4R33_005038 [Dimargaris cristalligena]|nr:hypothetical protein H4R33_005038 [Dimargaris cristalligena]